MSAKTNAERQANHRKSGRWVAVTIKDDAAIKSLDRHAKELGSIRAAIERGLLAIDQ